MTDEGTKVENDVGMCAIEHEYFNDIFTASSNVIMNFTIASPPVISHEQNQRLVYDLAFKE